ncbi:hypothetical protein ACFSTC_39700 [Nonomuraea ferruginea]
MDGHGRLRHRRPAGRHDRRRGPVRVQLRLRRHRQPDQGDQARLGRLSPTPCSPPPTRRRAAPGRTRCSPSGRTCSPTTRLSNTTRRKVGNADQTLVWDAEGNLESVTEAGKVTSFVYDADGDRLLRKTPTDATFYIDDMELRFDYAKDAVEQTRYYTIGGQPIAVRTPDNQVYFLVATTRAPPRRP